MSSLKRISEELRVLGETDLADQVTALFDKLGNDLSQTRWYTKREPKKYCKNLKL